MVGFIILLFEYLDKNMLVEGRIENVIIIVDCLNISIFNAPYGMLKSVLGTIQGIYKCKARAIFCINVPTSFSVLWNTVRYFIDGNTAQKVQIVYENTCPELQSMVLPEQLQQQFGGTADNKTDIFWPPECPTKNFGHKVDQIEKAVSKPKHSIKATTGVRTLFQKDSNPNKSSQPLKIEKRKTNENGENPYLKEMPEQVMEESDEDDDWCEIDARSDDNQISRESVHMQAMNLSKGLTGVNELGQMFSTAASIVKESSKNFIPTSSSIRSTALPEVKQPDFLALREKEQNNLRATTKLTGGKGEMI